MRTTKNQVESWLSSISDDFLRWLSQAVWAEGKRRGWSEFWTQ